MSDIDLAMATAWCVLPRGTHPLIAADVVDDADSAPVQERPQEVLVAVVGRGEQHTVLLPRLEAHRDVVRVRVPRRTHPDPDVIVPAERHDRGCCQPIKILVYYSTSLGELSLIKVCSHLPDFSPSFAPFNGPY